MSASLFDWLRERAVEIHVADHLRARLERGDRLRVKLGMDPTAPDIPVGHLVVLEVLRAFQDHGHKVVLIIGDFTALIGDPSGRSATRPVLTEAEVEKNAETYFGQVGLVLDRNGIEVRYNSEWLAGMGGADALRLMAKATLQQILQREDFADRLKSGAPISAHEILYPFNQAYDSVAVEADVEIGGTDQLFNLLFGRQIQEGFGQEPQDIAVFPLLEGLDGEQKMSKSLGNYIGISEPPEQIYGKTMSIPDGLIERYVRLVSGFTPQEAKDVLARKPRDAKAALARQLVKRLRDEATAAAAEESFERTFRRRDLSSIENERFAHRSMTAAEVAIQKGWATSFSEVRRLAEQGGLRVNDTQVAADTQLHNGDVIRYGKKRFLRVEFEE